MSKGRKPDSHDIVPLRDGVSAADFEDRAKTVAKQLKPRGLPRTVAKMWDRLAPPLCLPTRKYPLDRTSVYMFEQLCHTAARVEGLRAFMDENGETYKAQTRNGEQIKTIPEVGQYNEAFRQLRSLAAEFGMTPTTARAVQQPGQMAFTFDDDADDFD